MSVKLYRRDDDGELETSMVEPQYLEAELAAGWSLTDETEPGNPEPESEPKAKKESKAKKKDKGKEEGPKQTEPPKDEGNGGKGGPSVEELKAMSIDQLREAAKELGIEDADTLHHTKLKKALGL